MAADDFAPVGAAGTKVPVSVMYTLCGALALYPLLEQFVAPFLALAYLCALVPVARRLIVDGYRLPSSMIWPIWAIYSTIYVIWFLIALLHQNLLIHIVKDSFGFLLYLGVMPVLYLYIRFNALEARFRVFVEACAITIAALSMAVVGGFALFFGEITTESMLLTNLFIKGLGLSWTIDHNDGVLGLYTNTAHLVLLGSAIALHRYSLRPRKLDALLVLAYLAAMALDGRRALVITGILQILIVAPRVLTTLRSAQRFAVVGVVAMLVAAVSLNNLDWIQQRFAFEEDNVSTAARRDQVGPLLDKIAENPVLGGGFGTAASLVRSDERPFSYEVDFLATFMKLGLIGGLIYFGTYLITVMGASRGRGGAGLFLTSAGLAFFFYMGTNGNQAMSTDSAVFHIFLFLLIALSQPKQISRPRMAPLVAIPAP